MASAEYNFTIEQGTSFNKSFVWKDGTGTPVGLLGYRIRMQVRQSTSAEDVLLEATTENGRCSNL